LSSPKIGDLVRVKGQAIQGIVVGEEQVRHHQYLDRETYLKILISNPGGNEIKSFLIDGCEIIE